MAEYRAGLPERPPRIAKLPLDARGFPIPWFVARVPGDGDTPDFRVADPEKQLRALTQRRCWVCGDVLGRYLAFVIGPMCAINRLSAEPPEHSACALYCVLACPFLSNPAMLRRENDLPADASSPGGEMICRNPGVSLIWVTREVRPFSVTRPGGGRSVMFRLGDPAETYWFREGRRATRAEVLESIETGLPALQLMATQEGPEAEAALDRMHQLALHYVPA
jgi:hypothetical protein